MAEVINKDVLVSTLRYLHNRESGVVKDLENNVRFTTHDAALKVLQANGYVEACGSISDKGRKFLLEHKLSNAFRLDYTPYGVVYEGSNQVYLEEVKDVLKKRPVPDCTLDHQPLLPELTAMRAHYIATEEHLFDKKIAMVGDYDSTGLALNLITEVREMFVFDIDKRLLEYLRGIARDKKFPLHCINLDLFDPVPEEYIEQFDIFITDPPYAMAGMRKFIEFGIKVLKKDGVGFIAVPYHDNIDWTARMLFEVNKLIIENGCVITDTLKNFHRYQTADGLRSSMIRIKKGAKSLEIDLDKMYSFKPINQNYPVVKDKDL